MGIAVLLLLVIVIVIVIVIAVEPCSQSRSEERRKPGLGGDGSYIGKRRSGWKAGDSRLIRSGKLALHW